jgi:SAM-dependent methyltransferase
MRDPTTRFSDRVEDYVRFRPGYPPAVAALLRERFGLGRDAVVVDVGSGTGKLTELLLVAGWTVLAVEPNREMRAAAEALLGNRPGFVSVEGRAEATTLASGSVDLVTAAQAFHWFDKAAARVEFRRILRPGCCVALLWNERTLGSAFGEEYERLLEGHSVDYDEVSRRRTSGEDAAEAFLAGYEEASFDNPQETDLQGLIGRYLSASYALKRDDPRFPRAVEALGALYERHARGGRLLMPTTTRVYWGKV